MEGRTGITLMFELSTFYRTKTWRRLIATLRMERVNENGEVICEYCGKPIAIAYDIIGHHKIYLTEENVNDAEISLNPDNIQLVHHVCNNYIHDKLGYTKREVFVVYGSPLAGKTSYVKSVIVPGDLIVDMDSIWQCVSGCDRYIKPKRLNAVVFKMRDELLNAVKYRVGKWNNAYIIGGYPLEGERNRLCQELGAREVYIESSRDEVITRLEANSSLDNEEWMKYINDWWNKFLIEHENPAGSI